MDLVNRHTTIVLASALTLVSVLSACATSPASPSPAQATASPTATAASTSPLVGQPVPELKFLDLQDQERSYAEFKGKPTIVALFAYWCGHCQRELPRVQAFAKERGATLMPIESSNSPKADVEAFVKTYAIDVPTFYDPAARAGQAVNLKAFPTVMFIDSEGVVRDFTTGNFDPDVYARLIAEDAK